VKTLLGGWGAGYYLLTTVGPQDDRYLQHPKYYRTYHAPTGIHHYSLGTATLGYGVSVATSPIPAGLLG